MSDNYSPIARELHRVRRAWRRAAVLTGLALVAVETVGLFSVAVLLDILFQLGVAGRVALLALLVGATAWLLARHVLAPLVRRLPDAQVALFVEEHCPGFEGALIAAAEFGASAVADPQRHGLVAAILAEAEARARRIQARQAVDLTRLRKYGFAALGVLGIYALLGAAFPAGMRRHATRLVKPWQPEVAAPALAPAFAEKPPIEFTLSRGDTDLLRGTPFTLEAVLSREPDGPLSFHFCSLADEAAQDDGRWLRLAMQPLERLHAYAIEVPDVNEPLAFFVTAEDDRTPTYRITVYDPLTVEDLKITVRYPEYLDLPDRELVTPTGDVTVPEGAGLRITLTANRPLVPGGLLVLEDGTECPLEVSADSATTASARLTPGASTTYRYRIADDRDQRLESSVPSRLTVVADQPPTVTLRQPQQTITPLPIDEVTFAVEAGDDFGVAGIALVYRRALAPQPVRVPFVLAAAPGTAGGTGIAASLVLALESLQPPVLPKDVFTYHVEVTDRKGQTSVTPIGILPIRYLDVWAVEEPGTGEPPEPLSAKPELPVVLNTAWQIHSQRGRLPAAEVARQAEELARTMIDPATGEVWAFAEPKPGEHPPRETLEQYRRINALAAEGRQELVRHDTAAAVEKLREAVVIMVALGLVEDLEQLLAATAAGGRTVAAEFQPQAQALAVLETQAPAVRPPDAGTVREVDRAEQVRRQSLEVEELEIAQRQVVERLGALVQPAADEAAPAQREQRRLAAEQERLAAQAREAAEALRRASAAPDERLEQAADRLRAAARRMQAAAQELAQARPERARQPAREAREELTGVREQLTGLAQDQLVQALNQAEQQADRLLRRQDDIRRRTEPLARDLGEVPTPREQRDARILAADQARNQPDLTRLEGVLAALDAAAAAGVVPRDTVRYVQGAARDLRRGRVADKMTNSAVELAALRPANAVPEQQAAVRSLERTLENVRAANDSLVSDEGSELRRARREAKDLDATLGRLTPGAAATVDRTARPPQPRPADPTPLTPAERETLTAEAGVTLDQLRRHSLARKFLSDPVQRRLETYAAEHTVPRVVAEDDARAVELLDTVRKAHLELESAYQSHLAARRLFSAQREECPPQYRHLVNRYFEALSAANP